MDDHPLITNDLRKMIYAGQYAPGERLPSGVELAAQYSTAPTVIRRALRVLMDEGLLLSRSQDGVYVRTQQATTLAALRRLLLEAGELITDLETSRRLQPAQRAAITAWRERAHGAGAAT